MRVWWETHDQAGQCRAVVLRCVPEYVRDGPAEVVAGWDVTWWLQPLPGRVPVQLHLGSGSAEQRCRLYWPLPAGSGVAHAGWEGEVAWGHVTQRLPRAERATASVSSWAPGGAQHGGLGMPPPRAQWPRSEPAALPALQQGWYDRLLAGELGAWQCRTAARWSANHREYRPCHRGCSRGAPCDGSGCRYIPSSFGGVPPPPPPQGPGARGRARWRFAAWSGRPAAACTTPGDAGGGVRSGSAHPPRLGDGCVAGFWEAARGRRPA